MRPKLHCERHYVHDKTCGECLDIEYECQQQEILDYVNRGAMVQRLLTILTLAFLAGVGLFFLRKC